MKRIVFAAVLLVACAGGVQAQTGILLNPAGEITFDSPDHARLASYRIGWFKQASDTTPVATEAFSVSAVSVPQPGATTGLRFTVQTRPPFGAYVLRLKAVAPPTCEPTPPIVCETDWSDVAVWSRETDWGTLLGYTPRAIKGFVLK